jgi:FAD/FMN-containing dehydrogenase
LSREDWQRHYGERWPALLAAKRRYDPDNVFASGPDIFRKS